MSSLDARTLHPAGSSRRRNHSGDRCKAAAALQASLRDAGIDVPIMPAVLALECALEALDAPGTADRVVSRVNSRFDASWTPRDEQMLAQDQQIDDFAEWYEANFGEHPADTFDRINRGGDAA